MKMNFIPQNGDIMASVSVKVKVSSDMRTACFLVSETYTGHAYV